MASGEGMSKREIILIGSIILLIVSIFIAMFLMMLHTNHISNETLSLRSELIKYKAK